MAHVTLPSGGKWSANVGFTELICCWIKFWVAKTWFSAKKGNIQVTSTDKIIFTARRYTSTIYATALCQSFSPTCHKLVFIKTTKHVIMQTTLHDSLVTSVFSKQKYTWVKKNLQFSTNNLLCFENNTRYTHINQSDHKLYRQATQPGHSLHHLLPTKNS